jgi:hypothetical protein
VRITSEALRKSPSWKLDTPNPPLSAKGAIDLANTLKSSLVSDTEDYKWELKSASLTLDNSGKWYWLVYYEATRPEKGFIRGMSPHLMLVVLMDGTVIKPEIGDMPYSEVRRIFSRPGRPGSGPEQHGAASPGHVPTIGNSDETDSRK